MKFYDIDPCGLFQASAKLKNSKGKAGKDIVTVSNIVCDSNNPTIINKIPNRYIGDIGIIDMVFVLLFSFITVALKSKIKNGEMMPNEKNKKRK